jgi:hypothetical protein
MNDFRKRNEPVRAARTPTEKSKKTVTVTIRITRCGSIIELRVAMKEEK